MPEKYGDNPILAYRIPFTILPQKTAIVNNSRLIFFALFFDFFRAIKILETHAFLCYNISDIQLFKWSDNLENSTDVREGGLRSPFNREGDNREILRLRSRM